MGQMKTTGKEVKAADRCCRMGGNLRKGINKQLSIAKDPEGWTPLAKKDLQWGKGK